MIIFLDVFFYLLITLFWGVFVLFAEFEDIILITKIYGNLGYVLYI